MNAFANSFNQHNKVRRPGESHRGAGRKKMSSSLCGFLLVCVVFLGSVWFFVLLFLLLLL